MSASKEGCDNIILFPSQEKLIMDEDIDEIHDESKAVMLISASYTTMFVIVPLLASYIVHQIIG